LDPSEVHRTIKRIRSTRVTIPTLETNFPGEREKGGKHLSEKTKRERKDMKRFIR